MENYVYKYTYENEIIYIGKTDYSLKNRIYAHSKEEKFQPYLNADISFIPLANSAETKGLEALLINKYKPKLNVVDKYEGCSLLDFKEPEWRSLEYSPKAYHDKNIIKYCTIKNDSKDLSSQTNNINKYSLHQEYTIHELLNNCDEIIKALCSEGFSKGAAWFKTTSDPREKIAISPECGMFYIRKEHRIIFCRGDRRYIDLIHKGRRFYCIELNQSIYNHLLKRYEKERFVSNLLKEESSYERNKSKSI